MKMSDPMGGFEDMSALLRMEEDLEKEGVANKVETEDARRRLEYIKARLIKIAMSNDRMLKVAAENVIK